MKHLWIIVRGVMLVVVALSRSSSADIMQDFVVDEGTSPGTLIGRIDVPTSRAQGEEIPKPPYIIMSYQESVDRDLTINENTGEIRARIALDREVTDFYSFMAVPLMGGSNIRVKVAIRDINDHSPVFKDELVKIHFSESQPRDSRRSLPPATDADVGINTTQRYEIVSGNINNVFRLSSRRGRDGILYLDLEINGVLDRETIDHYLLAVEAYDGGNPPRSGRLMVDITLEDDNDNTPLFGESRYYASVMENATIGSVVLQVEATDADLGRNAQIQYSINRRQSDSEVFFEIDPSRGIITLNKVLDYERKASYELVVTARDNGSQVLESSTFVYIDIINVNDQAPQIAVVFLNNATGYIAEDVPVGHFVARLSVSDEEAAVDSSKITLNLTAGMDKFELMQESSTVYILRTKTLLDYEEASNYTVTLVASDGGQPPLTTEKSITIFLTDVNDNVPKLEKSLYEIEASESVENGTVLLHVLATDRDDGINAQLEYFLTSQTSGKLKVDPVSGVVTAGVPWKCEGEHSEDMVIGVRDKGVPALTSTAALRLSFRSDSDVLPVFEKPFYNVTLQAEDVHVGNCFLKVRADGSDCSSSSGKIHYALDAAWSDEHFRIDAITGQLCVAQSLEKDVGYPVRQLLLHATDIHRNSSTTAFLQIYLPPVVFFKSRYWPQDKYTTGVHNMAAIGTPVVQVKPVGQEEDGMVSEEAQFGWRFVYSITGGNDQQLFQVEPISGLIRVAKPLKDFTGLHKLDVIVREASSKLVMGNIQVSIRVDSQEPFFTNKIFKFVIAEDVTVGNTAGKLQISPQLSALSFTVQSPGSSEFEVDSATGVIRTKTLLNRETKAAHVFSVVAQYNSKPGQDTAQVMIAVGDVDDQCPTFRQAEVDLHVAESVVTGDAIFQAVALDRDTRHKRPVQYALTSPRQEHFHIDANTGLLIINKPLDYETSSVHNLTIAAIELATATPKHATMKLHIHVIDRNDHSPVFDNATYEIAVKEDTAVETILLKVKATDSDTGKSGRVTYQLDSAANIAHIFGVYPDTGAVFLRRSFDRETQDIYTFHIHATDHGQPQFKSVTTVRITVLDINDNTPKFTNNSHYEFSILENTVGRTVIGKVTALDADIGSNGRVTYKITCNDTGFEIDDSTGEISTRRTLDREDVSAYSCEVFATDGENNSSADVIIEVLDINDNAPVIVLPADETVWVPEGEPEGTEVLRVMAKDADEGENGRVVFSLEKDEDSYAFTIHPSSGTVRSQVVLDHEKQALFRLMIVASDRGNPVKVAKKAISVNVVDINDNRPTFSTNVMTIEVNEGTAAGVEIGSVLATDADSGENGRVTYSIVRGNVFGAFEIGRTSGKIYTTREVDYELAPSYMLRIRAVDSSSIKPKSNLLVVNVIVIDTNDSPPKFSSSLCLFSVKENVGVDTSVWNFSASDADSGSFGQVQYDIAYQFPQSSFKVHPMTGALSVAEPIDYERHKNYTLIVTASDRDPDRLRRKMTSLKCQIIIEDENDNAPKFVSRNIVRITENVAVGFPVTQMMAYDEDSFMSGNVTYEITRGNDERIFNLSALTGLISLNQPSSELKSKSYSLTIVATDNGTPRLATMQSLTIEVDSSSKQLQVFNQTLYEVSLKEDVALNMVVLSFAIPSNLSSQIRFSIPEEFLYGQFILDQNNGDLRTVKPLDREAKNSYVMNVYAANKANPSLYDFATIKVTVTDVNDNAPMFHESCHGLSLPENNEFSVVHKFIAVDRDEGENARVSYRIESGNDGQKFSINGETGELSSKPLDREEQGKYVLVVVAEDRGKPSLQRSCRMEIAVLDQNDNFPQFVKPSYKVHLSEESPVGTMVEQVQAVDKDIGENGRISYSIGNDSRGLIRINEASGLITTAGIFDHEVLRQYRVEVVATDSGNMRSQSTKVMLDIMVDDINDSAPEFSQYRYHVQAIEPIRTGQAITKVVAEDKDAGKNSNVLFSFDKPQDRFEIHPSTGVVTAKDDIVPQGTGQLFHMTVVAKDQGHTSQKSSTGLLDIMVGDAPMPSVSLQFSPSSYTASLLENSRVGTKVTIVKASRSDGSKAAIAYSIVNGNVGDIFQIDKNTGLIAVRHNADLDYEKYHRFNLTVLAETVDADRLQEHASVIVYGIDENDNAPRFGQNKYAASVLEGNNKGAFVVQLFATDDDSGKNGELTFEIVDGNTDGAFVIDPPFSGIVKTNRQIDREIQDTFKLTVVAKDAGVPRRTGTCILKVSIVDINDNDPVFPQYPPVSVSEGASVGTTVFTVKANDVDSNSEVTYAVVGSDNKNFTINRLTGAITVAAPLDRERQAQHVLTIQASDKVHTAITKLTINVADINDNNPVFSQAKYEVTVPELTPPGTALLTLRANDKDEEANGRIKFSLPLKSVSGFAIDERTGVLSSTKTLLYDAAQPLTILGVQAEDSGNPKLSSLAEVQIRITSLNRNAPVFTRTVYSVHLPENAPLGRKVLQVSATDPDAANGTPSVKYTLLGDSENIFQIDDRSGLIVLVRNVDREKVATYSLKVVASDFGRPVRNSTAEVIVYIDDVNDSAPKFNETEYKTFVNEAVAKNTAVLQVKATDYDAGENGTISYSILTGNEAGKFKINSVTGIVEVVGELDYEATTEYKLMIQAADNGAVHNQSSVVEATIYVTDANDHAPSYSVSRYSERIAENSPAGTLIFTAQAYDRDEGLYGKLQYSIAGEDGTSVFEIEPTSGKVFSKVAFDYEQKHSYNFVVTAKDSGDRRADVQVTVNVESQDEYPPVFAQKAYRFYVSPQAKQDEVVGQVMAYDQDAGPDGLLVYKFQNPSDLLHLNNSTGVITLKMDFHIENDSTKEGNGSNAGHSAVKPEVSALVIADSGREGSKSDAALVVVIFGEPEVDVAQTWQTQSHVIIGVTVGIIVLVVALLLMAVLCVQKQRRKACGRQTYANSDNGLQYSAFHGIDNSVHGAGNHYHDPINGTLMHCSDASSSGRGSAEDDEVRAMYDGRYCPSTAYKKVRRGTGFPREMPDSGLPEMDEMGDYTLKVPVPLSAPGSHESIHRFDVEGGDEEQYKRPSDQERCSHSSSSASSGAASRFSRLQQPPKVRLAPGMSHDTNIQAPAHCEKLDYLLWYPEYYGQMAAVYSEIADFPHLPSERSSVRGQDSSSSVYFSKTSSQTTLPSIPPHLQHRYGRADYMERPRDNTTFSNRH